MNKLPIFEWFYPQGDVMVTVNTHITGVDIPPDLRQQEIVDFILGDKPTPKLTADGVGISAPMRFHGSLYSCYFPWACVLQMSGQEAVMQFRNPTPVKGDFGVQPKQAANKKRRGNLRVVK
ncbi:hypothetical protein MNBD_NITROSPINAE03-230 [hydrothermal vent metagenome]|uniref:Uncharacterized protein n=1 Tax=hydrothermal vent metagenome TaxID=652676 RepID=A0A3B1BKP6_9ZZZZ